MAKVDQLWSEVKKRDKVGKESLADTRPPVGKTRDDFCGGSRVTISRVNVQKTNKH